MRACAQKNRQHKTPNCHTRNMARLSEHGIRLSAMSPSFLNSNSTSHTWPFSAVAELTDNASDPGVSAKQIWIDTVEERGQLCLTFTDNGCGMTPNKLHKMLSFGFTEKGSMKFGHMAIGVYGNGFKSGSMRLGRDALIFTKNGGCQSVGLLSQTYLENIKAQAVIIPIVPFNQQTKCLVTTEDSEASLAAILKNSIVNTVEEIHAHFDSMPSKKGTKILIWNIRRGRDGKTEIDFETDDTDFRLPPIQIQELMKDLRGSGTFRTELNIPEIQCSLREYLSILYLKPRTQIILRGKKIMAKLMSKRLMYIEHDVYKPQFSKDRVKVTFGLIPKKKDHYGIMMYHKNRLIKAYEKVGCQLKASGQRAGVGVIGVIECNFLKPAHNKQDFEYTKEYRLTLSALGIKLNEYWREVTERQAKERAFNAVDKHQGEEETFNDNAPTWIQCEECLKWRSVPPDYYDDVPDTWQCSQNPNPRYRSCSAPEEMEDREELLTASYQKSHKKPEHPKNRRREKLVVVCEKMSLEELAKHDIQSYRSSEPVQPVHTPDHVTTEEDTPEQDQTNSDHEEDDGVDAPADDDDAHAQPSPVEREKVIKDKTKEKVTVKNETSEEMERHSDANRGQEGDANMEKREQSAEAPSYKRKLELLFGWTNKKLCNWNKEKTGSESIRDKISLQKQTQMSEAASSEKSRQDGSSPAVKPVDISQRSTWLHSAPSTQTVVVSPLSRMETPQSRSPPPEESEQLANELKLARLEKEAQKLRRLLGLEITKISRGTMTTADPDKPGEHPAAFRASREVGCQTDTAEQSSTSSHCLAQPSVLQGVVERSQRAVQGVEEQPEQSKPKKKDLEDGRSSHECLRSIRHNVVVLLTALLPQLDLTGICLESSDVDNILRQIIEVNSLKM